MTRKLAAEFFGTFWLVLGGCGSAVLAAAFPELGIGFAGVALAFGLTVLTMAYAVGGISGGHFNPAVSLGLAVAGRFAWKDLVPYWVAQVLGAIASAAVIYAIASGKAGFVAGGFATNGFGDLSPGGYSLHSALLIEVVMTAGFLIAGVSAWQLLKGTATDGTRKALRTAITAVALVIPLQIFMGDLHGLNTLEHQPAKIAAIEGIWHTEKGAPLTLFGLPNEKEGRTDYALQIPKFASLILAHDINAELKGLNEFPGAHPPVAPVFWGFRVMVGVGMLMLAVAWVGAFVLYRRRAQDLATLPRPLLYTLVGMTFSGWVATLAGWYVTEIGRQPYLVYGLFKTADAVAPHAPAMVATTLGAYLTVYVLLLAAYVGVIKYMSEHPTMPVPAVAPPAPQPLTQRPSV